MIAVRFSIFHTTAPSLIASHFFTPKLRALPTTNKKVGNTRSVGVNPCQCECRNWENAISSLTCVLTMIMKQTVIPRKISSASERLDETGVVTVIEGLLSAEYSKIIDTGPIFGAPHRYRNNEYILRNTRSKLLKTKTLHTKLALAALSLLFTAGTVAQRPFQVSRFREGTVAGSRNISSGRLRKETLLPARFAGRYYVVLQFDRLPDPGQKRDLEAAHVHLFDYVPDHSYLAEVDSGFSPAGLKRYAISNMALLPPAVK